MNEKLIQEEKMDGAKRKGRNGVTSDETKSVSMLNEKTC
jgi:hypothetical protein